MSVVPSYRRNDEASLFREATLFVLPSFFEGQPLALLQAMEAGRCCIASRCCGQKEFVSDGTTGLLHEPGDWRGVAALIEAAIADPPRRLAIGRAARAAMKTRAWPEVTGDVVDFVEGVRPRERC